MENLQLELKLINVLHAAETLLDEPKAVEAITSVPDWSTMTEEEIEMMMAIRTLNRYVLAARKEMP